MSQGCGSDTIDYLENAANAILARQWSNPGKVEGNVQLNSPVQPGGYRMVDVFPDKLSAPYDQLNVPIFSSESFVCLLH